MTDPVGAKDAPAADVDAYLATLVQFRRERVAAVRAAVHAVYPDVVERIEWKMPVFARGDRWIAVASQKSYVSVYLRSVDWAAKIAATDPKLGRGKGCLNIKDGAAMPVAAIAEAVRAMLR